MKRQDDIHEGANVVARDGEGNTLGVTDLGGGEYYTPPDGKWFETTCRFSFEVERVSEAPSMQLRLLAGKARRSQHDLETDDWHIELTLG